MHTLAQPITTNWKRRNISLNISIQERKLISRNDFYNEILLCVSCDTSRFTLRLQSHDVPIIFSSSRSVLLANEIFVARMRRSTVVCPRHSIVGFTPQSLHVTRIPIVSLTAKNRSWHRDCSWRTEITSAVIYCRLHRCPSLQPKGCEAFSDGNEKADDWMWLRCCLILLIDVNSYRIQYGQLQFLLYLYCLNFLLSHSHDISRFHSFNLPKRFNTVE